jgi:hypothetical protein
VPEAHPHSLVEVLQGGLAGIAGRGDQALAGADLLGQFHDSEALAGLTIGRHGRGWRDRLGLRRQHRRDGIGVMRIGGLADDPEQQQAGGLEVPMFPSTASWRGCLIAGRKIAWGRSRAA